MRRAPRPCSSSSRNGLVYSPKSIYDGQTSTTMNVEPRAKPWELNTASQLQVLDLADNLIGQKEEVSEMREGYVTGGEALGAMLAASSTLTVLNLSWNSIRARPPRP